MERRRLLNLLGIALIACVLLVSGVVREVMIPASSTAPGAPASPALAIDTVTGAVTVTETTETTTATATMTAAASCATAKNVCPDYAPSWSTTCPAGARCLTFTNASPTATVALAYQIGCNGDGTPGAPQCNCTPGPKLAPGGSAAFTITDGDYTSCLPSWQPACLTAGLAVIANADVALCTKGTRVEFTAGNSADPYGKADFYNVDVEKDWFGVPVNFQPNLTCAHDNTNHDCRPLWCGEATCPDAYSTPTTGGCADGRSPQAACQDTFGDFRTPTGFTVTYWPANCAVSSCPSCQNATACP